MDKPQDELLKPKTLGNNLSSQKAKVSVSLGDHRQKAQLQPRQVPEVNQTPGVAARGPEDAEKLQDFSASDSTKTNSMKSEVDLGKLDCDDYGK